MSNLLVIAPPVLDRVPLDLAAVTMLAELGVRFGLEGKHVRPTSTLEAEGLDVDAADPVVLVGVLPGIDVDVRSTHTVRDLQLL